MDVLRIAVIIITTKEPTKQPTASQTPAPLNPMCTSYVVVAGRERDYVCYAGVLGVDGHQRRQGAAVQTPGRPELVGLRGGPGDGGQGDGVRGRRNGFDLHVSRPRSRRDYWFRG